MTNLRSEAHHKICHPRLTRPRTVQSHGSTLPSGSEAGYTLVALLALMTILGLFAVAAAPSIQQQSQREREKEAIFRGEQVADAIRDYYIHRVHMTQVQSDQSLPTSIDQLLEGVPILGGSKKRQILRPSAARDPLSASTEWRLIRPRSQGLIDFQRSVMIYAGNFLPLPQNAQVARLQQFAVPPMVNVFGEPAPPSSSSEDSSFDSSGPFVGVTSRSSNNSVLYYYGIDRHDQWIFTPLFR